MQVRFLPGLFRKRAYANEIDIDGEGSSGFVLGALRELERNPSGSPTRPKRQAVTALSRLLLRRHGAAFGTAFAALTALFLANQMSKQLPPLLHAGVPAGAVVKVFVLSLPFMIAMTLPMAVLIAVLRVFSRLGRDGRVAAIETSSVSARRLMAPVLTAAAGLAVLAFLWNDQILPRANHRLRILLLEVQRDRPATTPDTVTGDREMSIGELQAVVRSAQADTDSALAQGREADADAARRRAAVYEVEIQKKLAISAACFILALFGAPIGLRFQGRGVGLVTGMSLSAFMVSYVGLIAGEDLGDRLLVSPFLAMWLPNLLFAVVGLLAMWRIPGLASVSLPVTPADQAGHYLTRLWQGRIPLDVTYWIWGGLIEILLWGIRQAAGRAGLPLPFTVIYFAYAAFVLVPIWRSAGRYQGRRVWVALARISVGLRIVSLAIAFIAPDLIRK